MPSQPTIRGGSLTDQIARALHASVPIALFAGGEVRFLEKLAAKEQWDAQNLLLRRHVPAVLADLA